MNYRDLFILNTVFQVLKTLQMKNGGRT